MNNLATRKAKCELRGGDFSSLRRPRRSEMTAAVEGARLPQPAENVDDAAGRTPVEGNLQNPSDALLILANAANEGGTDATSPQSVFSRGNPSGFPAGPQPSANATYAPLERGILTLELLHHLVDRYSHHYHSFLPIAPRSVLQLSSLPTTIEQDSFLLTAILVVASQDRPDLVYFHTSIWQYMRQLILDLVFGAKHTQTVGCVEGLLILGEWQGTSIVESQNDSSGEGASWSIIGLAVRLAYALRLEESSFKGTRTPDDLMLRQRLAWTFTYLSDRQISIRMGQAFWCRGPALSTRFTAADFPSLQPKFPYEEDLSSLLEAQVELTTLFGNAHDILFASKSRTAELMVRGDYTKYIDDTMKAVAAWKRCWSEISASRHLKACLMLMYQYLKLYVNAFAFQAVLYRASLRKNGSGRLTFPASAMASPDARHIYQALEAAEDLLKTVIEDIDPEKGLRFMPTRFYLYEIHSAVFIFKARVAGAISNENHEKFVEMMRRFVSSLNRATTGDRHIASRYSKLLQRLWFDKTASMPQDPDTSHQDLLSSPGPIGPSLGTSTDPLTTADSLGLQYFDFMDSTEGLFSMPLIPPMEQPMYDN
ncbi:hypothetical protein G7054_g12334 [Neopestalotiopsis clavispora]|nr:hypothetical protein G7054_g12334 [Neopestalotiopsis clavispora]